VARKLEAGQEHGATPVQAKRFRDYLLGKGLVAYRTKEMRGFRGIRVEVNKDAILTKNLDLDAESGAQSPELNVTAVRFPKRSR
jgi:hypothetical protein